MTRVLTDEEIPVNYTALFASLALYVVLAQAEMEERKVRYLRGDNTRSELSDSRSAFYRFVYMYYDDVESEYRESVFELVS